MNAPSEILTPGTHLWRAGAPARPGALVVLHAQGRYRVARVVKAGPMRTTVEYGTSTTPHRTKAVPHALLYVTDPRDPAAVVGSSEDAYAVVRQHGYGAAGYRPGTARLGGHYLEGGEDL